MPGHARQVAVLGSTGSIGRSTLEVIAASGGTLAVAALSAHAQTGLLLEQAQAFRPRWVAVTDAEAARRQDWSGLPRATELFVGPEALARIASADEVDVVVTAIVGSAGLTGTWAAVEAGKTIALANKETLVVAGALVSRLASQQGTRIVPVDSEHSAIHQALRAGRREDLQRIILTASGGPFLRRSAAELAQVTVDDALRHPTWRMGPKITIDSATLMNKALEIIEARWLFDLQSEQIDVVIHPQSIVHSMVEFIDGSVVAQMSPPDMKLPIQYALCFPARAAAVAPRMDFRQAQRLEFEPPDFERFPALGLGLEVARRGGTCGAVLNAANEVAVAAFLAGTLEFTRIVPAARAVLEAHTYDPRPSLESLLALDAWARKETQRWIRL